MGQVEAAIGGGGIIAPPSDDAIRAQLGRIQTSADFEVPDRAHKFLGYVVEETLAGRGERIKAYSIALEVFGRDSSFDAQADPVVRIEAGRVRRALERYYFTAGRSDSILITIPKGGYVPLFAPRAEEAEDQPEASEPVAETTAGRSSALPRRSWIAGVAGIAAVLAITAVFSAGTRVGRQSSPEIATEALTSPDIPRLLIEPFDDLTGSTTSKVITRGLSEEIIGQIARFKDLVVIDGRQAAMGAGEEVGSSRPARYILTGSVRTEGSVIRLSARLRSAEDNSILWAQSFDANRQVQELLSIQAEIARNVTTALAQPYGIIFQADAVEVAETAPDDWQAYTCTLAYYTYRLDLDPETYAFVRNCLERTVKQFPAYSTAWALLAIAYFDGFRFRYSIKPTLLPPIDQAIAYARRAVELDPQNVRGQQALMMALALNQEVPAALEVGRRALTLNPNDIELRGEYGVRLALSGEWKQGGELIMDTLQRSAGPEGYYETNLALSAYMLRDNETAGMWIRKADVQANPLYHFIAAAIFGHMGAEDEAVRERDWILENARALLDNIHEEVAIRIARPEDRAYIIEGFTLADLPVPPEP